MEDIYILGISAFYHDSAACIIKNGDILAAAQEERFTRKKHDFNFPNKAIEYCLKEVGISVEQLSQVAFYDKPFIKFERLLETYSAFAPLGIASFIKAMPLWLKQKLWLPVVIKKELNYEGKVTFAEHHESHAASAFYPSPFKEAAIITMDGVGEWATASYGIGRDNKIELLSEIKFPHSLGLLYSAFTYFAGFRVNSGEYKLMGLAPYGEPKYVDLIMNELIDLKEDGSFRLNMKYFNYCAGLTMTNGKFSKLFDWKPRRPESKMQQKDMDIAKSIQVVTEEIMLKMARHIHKETGMKNLCIAGGVGLNCVGNGRLLREGPFENIWVQPAAGDAGGALGVALLMWYRYYDNERNLAGEGRDKQKSTLLGPMFSDEDIKAYLTSNNIPYRMVDKQSLVAETAKLLKEGNVIGWFQGRMEFGPRALGSRSILGNPILPDMQPRINLKIKFRESFRPFAPSLLREHMKDYFTNDVDSPYMLFTTYIRDDKRIPLTEEQQKLFGIDKLKIPRSDIPAVTHVDYSARIQTVSHQGNPLYYELIKEFHDITGCPVVINTSFNVRGEPIVCTPDDAYKCFMRTDMDYLAIGNFLVSKKEQRNIESFKGELPHYEPD